MFSVEELVIQHRNQKVTVVNVKRRAATPGRADGMGILYMGYESVFCGKPPPWLRAAASLLTEAARRKAAACSELVSTGSNMAFTENLQTILDTGAIKLIRTASASNQGQLERELQSTHVWVFNHTGPNIYYPQLEGMKAIESGELDGDEEEEEAVAGAVSTHAQTGGAPQPINKRADAQVRGVLDLNTCGQFSIVRYEDLSDSKKSMIMIQTPERETVHHVQSGLTIQAFEDAQPSSNDLSQNNDTSASSSGAHRPDEMRLEASSNYADATVPDKLYGNVCSTHLSGSHKSVRSKARIEKAEKQHLDSSPEDNPIPVLSSPSISKYLNRDNPQLFMSSFREGFHDEEGEFADNNTSGEYASRCRPKAHSRTANGDAVNSAKELRLKAKLADTGLYKSSGHPQASGDAHQLSLSNDMDSGIWDMIQGKEGDQDQDSMTLSSRGSTPVLHYRSEDARQMAPLISDIQELNIHHMLLLQNPLETPGDKPSIAYRAFKVDCDTNEVTLSKAKVATYLPLLDEQPTSQLAISEHEDDVRAITDAQENAQKSAVLEETARSDSDNEDYESAVDTNSKTAETESETAFESAFETAVESVGEATETELNDEDWEVVNQSDFPAEIAANSLQNPADNACDITPVAEVANGTGQLVLDEHQPGDMVNEGTQTSPVKETAAKSKKVRKTSVSRQRSYAQALRLEQDITSPEDSESGWQTAKEAFEPSASRKVPVKPRRKKSEGKATTPGAVQKEVISISKPAWTSSDVVSTSEDSHSSTESQSTPTEDKFLKNAESYGQTPVAYGKEFSTSPAEHALVPSTTPVDQSSNISELNTNTARAFRPGSITFVTDVPNAMHLNEVNTDYVDAATKSELDTVPSDSGQQQEGGEPNTKVLAEESCLSHQNTEISYNNKQIPGSTLHEQITSESELSNEQLVQSDVSVDGVPSLYHTSHENVENNTDNVQKPIVKDDIPHINELETDSTAFKIQSIPQSREDSVSSSSVTDNKVKAETDIDFADNNGHHNVTDTTANEETQISRSAKITPKCVNVELNHDFSDEHDLPITQSTPKIVRKTSLSLPKDIAQVPITDIDTGANVVSGTKQNSELTVKKYNQESNLSEYVEVAGSNTGNKMADRSSTPSSGQLSNESWADSEERELLECDSEDFEQTQRDVALNPFDAPRPAQEAMSPEDGRVGQEQQGRRQPITIANVVSKKKTGVMTRSSMPLAGAGLLGTDFIVKPASRQKPAVPSKPLFQDNEVRTQIQPKPVVRPKPAGYSLGQGSSTEHLLQSNMPNVRTNGENKVRSQTNMNYTPQRKERPKTVSASGYATYASAQSYTTPTQTRHYSTPTPPTSTPARQGSPSKIVTSPIHTPVGGVYSRTSPVQRPTSSFINRTPGQTPRGATGEVGGDMEDAGVGVPAGLAGLNQLRSTNVMTRTPQRPTTVTSRQGVGLNQLHDPPSQSKPSSASSGGTRSSFSLSLLSPGTCSGGSRTPSTGDQHSPGGQRSSRPSSRSSDNSYIVASYDAGSDWGDESLLWDADEDDDDDVISMTTQDGSEADFGGEVESHPDWMSELPDRLHDLPLAALAIPGSHISFAIERDLKTDMEIAKSNYEMAGFLRKLPNLSIFNNFRALIKQIWKAWMPKQALSVAAQLQAGVRYLDIRVTKFRSALYAEHGLYSKPLIKYLKQIKLFLDTHPREVLLLHFEALNQIDTRDKRRLVTSLFQIFGARMAKCTSDVNKVTLNSLWRRKKQVIIIFPAEDFEILYNHIFVGLIWPDTFITTQTPKAQTQQELRTFLDGTYYNAQSARTKKDTFQVTRAVLSPDMSMLFGEYEYQSMRDLTLQETHTCVTKWLEHKSNINIVSFDFVGANGVIGKILKLNELKSVVRHTTV